MIGLFIGTVKSYDPEEKTARIGLTSRAKVGDRLQILGPRTNLEVEVREMHTRSGNLAISATKGRQVVISPPAEVLEGDHVYRLVGRSLPEVLEASA
jgi:hypothetical protein